MSSGFDPTESSRIEVTPLFPVVNFLGGHSFKGDFVFESLTAHMDDVQVEYAKAVVVEDGNLSAGLVRIYPGLDAENGRALKKRFESMTRNRSVRTLIAYFEMVKALEAPKRTMNDAKSGVTGVQRWLDFEGGMH